MRAPYATHLFILQKSREQGFLSLKWPKLIKKNVKNPGGALQDDAFSLVFYFSFSASLLDSYIVCHAGLMTTL